jgi:hypothetical protein
MLPGIRSVMSALPYLLLSFLPGLFLFQADAGIREKFLELHAKADAKGCAALWTEKPALALPTLEKDLDEALALRLSEKADAKVADALEARALWGARIAREALAAPMIADLAASRAGWTERDRRFHGEAKSVQERAQQWLEKGESKFALEAAQEAVNRSLGIGDWHGAARAYETCALAHQGTSNFEDALVAWEMARWIDRGLRLDDRELACVRGALDMCGAADRHARGREIADEGVALARRLGDKKSEADFLDRRARFEEKLGLAAEAQATRKELGAIGK